MNHQPSMDDETSRTKDGPKAASAGDPVPLPADPLPAGTAATLPPTAPVEPTGEPSAPPELPAVAKVPAPKITRTEEQVRRDAQLAPLEWNVARAPQGDIFSRRISAAQTAYSQVFRELDRRPMPTYKPGEPLDPLLELRENPRLLQAALDEMHSLRRRLERLPVVVRPREGDEP
ncbi:MAG: hypothetical protein QOH85_478, partial [Acidobacteriaceae bacterium]|nr:hypothetical protein [Acidobacteriaceae bacterium]